MSQETRKKKKKEKSVLKKITDKLSRDETEPDDLVLDTIGELKDIVGSMRNVFEEFEDGYDKQLEEERSSWQKIQSKLPQFLQSSSTKTEEHRVKRIKNNKNNLSDLEENLSKLEIILSSSNQSLDMLSEAYVKTASVGSKDEEKTVREIEARMDKMQQDITGAMGEMTAQITLIKAALDNMAGQLDEQGVKLDGIDGKIDTIDGKLDKAHEMLKKISKQITGNRLIMLAVVITATAVVASKFVN
jgi:DNA repair ATPase RecN